MFTILCDNWETLFSIKVSLNPEVLFNRHTLALFEARDLKEARNLLFYLHNTNTKGKVQCKRQSWKIKLSFITLN